VDLVEGLFRAMRSEPLPTWMDLDLTVPQIRVLCLLEEGPAGMGQMARVLGLRLPSVTHLVDRLVERGLVERYSGYPDRRRVFCRLTGEGRALVERLWRANRQRVEETLRRLSPAERERVAEGLRLLLRAVQERAHEARQPKTEEM